MRTGGARSCERFQSADGYHGMEVLSMILLWSENDRNSEQRKSNVNLVIAVEAQTVIYDSMSSNILKLTLRQS